MQVDTTEYTFNEQESAEIRKHVAKYPEARSAVMPALWIAQEKFGWLSEGAIRLVAIELDLPFSHVYGVASFYTMYLKKRVPKYLLDICTCFTCGECGGNKIYEAAKNKLQTDENGFSADGLFYIRHAECLGACDAAPVMQVANRRIVNNLTDEKLGNVIEGLKNDKMPAFESIPPVFNLPGTTNQTPPPKPQLPIDEVKEEPVTPEEPDSQLEATAPVEPEAPQNTDKSEEE